MGCGSVSGDFRVDRRLRPAVFHPTRHVKFGTVILLYLERLGGRADRYSISRVAAETGMYYTSASRYLRELDAAKYIRRQVVRLDGVLFDITLTDAGRHELAGLRRFVEADHA